MLRDGHLQSDWIFSTRWFADGERAWRSRFTLDYAVNPRFSVGLESSPGRREVLPRATWFATPKKGYAPALSMGVSSDRLSIPRGHGIFLTGTWSVGEVSPFVSLKYGTDEERLAFPFGANVRLAPTWTLQGLYDGNYTHLILTTRHENQTYSLVLGKSRYLGVQTTIAF